MEAKLEVTDVNPRDADKDLFIDSGEETPENELDIDGRASEDPDEEPGKRFKDWIIGSAHDAKCYAQDNCKEHREKS